MESISIRYGESLTLPLDAGNVSAVSADMFIGRPGQSYTLTKHIDLTDGHGVFNFSSNETEIPIGIYCYQINITNDTGHVEKYPSPGEICSNCENGFPTFVIYEALDELEIS